MRQQNRPAPTSPTVATTTTSSTIVGVVAGIIFLLLIALTILVLASIILGLLRGQINTINDTERYARHCEDLGMLSTRCDDDNPCTADKLLRDQTCVNRKWPEGAPCNSTCLVANETSALCINGHCEALPTDCLGYCPYTFMEDCDATNATCLEMVGCPPLPLGVGVNTTLPDPISMERVACVLHSCRYAIFAILLQPNLSAALPVLPSSTAACSEWLNRSDARVREGCFDSDRIAYSTFDLIFQPLNTSNSSAGNYLVPVNLSAVVACTFSYHCAPYDTTLPPVNASSFDASTAEVAAAALGPAVQTGSITHDVYAIQSYLQMASNVLSGAP